jgi:hypothetical protein
MTTQTAETVNADAIISRLLAEQAARLARVEDRLHKLIARERERSKRDAEPNKNGAT